MTRHGDGIFRLAPTLVLAVGALAWPRLIVAQEQTTVVCSKCHENRTFLSGAVGADERARDLLVPDSILRGTQHEGLACAACHPTFGEGYPHRASATALPCQTCHEDQGAGWSESIHAANVREEGDAASCVDCHSAHTVFGTDDRQSPTHPLNVAALCGGCHADPRIVATYFASPEDTTGRTAVARFHETVHGVALTRAGLTVAATCNDCHRAHEVLPADSAGSSVSRANIPETCGSCHVGILETYQQSAHGTALAAAETTENGRVAPVCTDCHSAHGIVRADEPQWFIGSVEECGACHEELYETYFETYHGKVTRLGFGLTAKCSDCHTAHDMRPASDIRSSVHAVNIVETCAQCHPAANQNFARYYAHGDPRQREKYPLLFWPWVFMTGLLAAVFTFFGAHTLLWLARLTIDRVRRRRAGAPSGLGPGE